MFEPELSIEETNATAGKNFKDAKGKPFQTGGSSSLRLDLDRLSRLQLQVRRQRVGC